MMRTKWNDVLHNHSFIKSNVDENQIIAANNLLETIDLSFQACHNITSNDLSISQIEFFNGRSE